MQILATLEPMLIQGFKNGMSFKQIEARMPSLVARKLSITEAQFHQLLEEEAGPFNRYLGSFADRIAQQLTEVERARVIARK